MIKPIEQPPASVDRRQLYAFIALALASMPTSVEFHSSGTGVSLFFDDPDDVVTWAQLFDLPRPTTTGIFQELIEAYGSWKGWKYIRLWSRLSHPVGPSDSGSGTPDNAGDGDQDQALGGMR